jgi:hypothetical protein
MDGSSPLAYLTRLPKEQQTLLARVNEPGWSALTEYLASGDAIAFLGAGASAPLYPLWAGLIGELIDAAGERLTTSEAVTCRGLAADSAEEVVQILKDHLRGTGYLEALRQALRVRTDPESGRSWTAVQELVCRCMFKGIVTTNYDRGIVDARMRVRPGASGTGFITWDDALNLDRWRTGKSSETQSYRCCSRTDSTTGLTLSCLPQTSTSAPMRGSCPRFSVSWSTLGT